MTRHCAFEFVVISYVTSHQIKDCNLFTISSITLGNLRTLYNYIVFNFPALLSALKKKQQIESK